jgi:hypothetical protein
MSGNLISYPMFMGMINPACPIVSLAGILVGLLALKAA